MILKMPFFTKKSPKTQTNKIFKMQEFTNQANDSNQ